VYAPCMNKASKSPVTIKVSSSFSLTEVIAGDSILSANSLQPDSRSMQIASSLQTEHLPNDAQPFLQADSPTASRLSQTLAVTSTVASSVVYIAHRKSTSGAPLKPFALFAVFSLCFISSDCFAQSPRWVEVGGNDDITAYADTQSMRRTGVKVKVWLKWVNTSPVETSTVFPKKTFLSEKTLAVYHCTDRSSTTLQVIRYANADFTGEVVESLNGQDTPSTYRDIAPETIGEGILNYACKATAGAKK